MIRNTLNVCQPCNCRILLKMTFNGPCQVKQSETRLIEWLQWMVVEPLCFCTVDLVTLVDVSHTLTSHSPLLYSVSTSARFYFSVCPSTWICPLFFYIFKFPTWLFIATLNIFINILSILSDAVLLTQNCRTMFRKQEIAVRHIRYAKTKTQKRFTDIRYTVRAAKSTCSVKKLTFAELFCKKCYFF